MIVSKAAELVSWFPYILGACIALIYLTGFFCGAMWMRERSRRRIKRVKKKLLTIRDLEPEYAKLVNEHFWDLTGSSR
jgi:hypothetical protein